MKKTRLRDIREDNDKTQEEIAKILQISRQYYSRYELEEIELPIRHYITLAKYYNISIDYLCGIIELPKPLKENKNITRIQLTAKQNKILKNYKDTPEYQKAIDKLLNI